MAGFLGCECMLLGHVEFFIPQIFLCRAALNHLSTQPVGVSGTALNQVYNLALGLAELHEIHMGPSLKPIQIPLNGILSLQRVDVILVSSAILMRVNSIPLSMSPIKISSVGPSTGPWRDTISHWSPRGQ
ncbi:hypothetical protein DUI87_12949 [Hirundo rustica rustica]|uniref:Uncharacterized protein n=1 Tax=Hirundo rustica rustica TaxID=333673 RepID=A0A3M0KGL4_HIRRU|nr:hypothetical protein DUI87_12949 [Hirundo rustica rustica]